MSHKQALLVGLWSCALKTKQSTPEQLLCAQIRFVNDNEAWLLYSPSAAQQAVVFTAWKLMIMKDR